MALADYNYKKCYICQGKALYDGDDSLEARLLGAAECEVLCEDCARTHVLVALPMATTSQLLLQANSDRETERLRGWGTLYQLLRPVWVNAPGRPDRKAKEVRDAP